MVHGIAHLAVAVTDSAAVLETQAVLGDASSCSLPIPAALRLVKLVAKSFSSGLLLDTVFALGTVAALLLFRAFEMDWTTILSNLAALMGVSLLAVAEVTVAGAWLGAALAPEPLFSFCLVVLSHLTMISS